MKLFFVVCLCLAFCLSVMAEDNGKDIEEMILANADKDIEKYRKSDVIIEIVNKKGRPIKNTEININQTSSDFLFAANVTLITGDLGGKIPIEHYLFQPRLTTKEQEDEFKRKFADLFNCAAIPLYWNSVEPDAGKPDYTAVDRVLEWCKSQGIKVSGHPLVWTHGDNLPQWFRNLSVEEQRKALEKHVRDTVSRYKGKIDMWDVVNEAAWAKNTLAGMTMLDYTSLPFLWAKESDPNTLLAINDAHKITPSPEMELLMKILSDFNKNNVPYDIIGIQAHIDRMDRFRLEEVVEMLKKYEQFGKTIHVTEFTPCSDGSTINNSWKQGKWTEEEQADYVAKFYKTCFSIPTVNSIGWWDTTDYSSWQTGGGVLRADLTPKPVYDALKNLIHVEWRTKTQGKTDKKGSYSFRGFHGKYDVSIVFSDGKKVKKDIHVKKDGDNKFRIVID
jgi:endo-1,4-beta-xylanase